MRKILGEDAEQLFYALDNTEPQKAFRVNTLKISAENFAAFSALSAEPIPYADNCFYTDAEHPGSTVEHLSGMIYMQDPSAIGTVCAATLREGDRVLDTCAAPGGKTTQLSALIGDGGVLLANEYVTKRARILQSNVERLGCKNVAITNLDTKHFREPYRAFFDLVVVDAPCSGEGMFRKNSIAVDEWSEENVIMCASRQVEILDNVADCVKVGGHLLYSTCTFSLEENEMNVDAFLDRHKDFSLVPVSDVLREHTSDGICYDGCRRDMTLTRRFYPHVTRGEGQFIALMERVSDSELPEAKEVVRRKSKSFSESKKSPSETADLRTAEEFLHKNLVSRPDGELYTHNGSIYLRPDLPLPEFGLFSCGVCLGEVRKGRLVPHHHLFTAYGHLFKNKVELSPIDANLKKYFEGQEIPAPDSLINGWGVVTTNGVACGGVKISSGVCKNHFPKGCRE